MSFDNLAFNRILDSIPPNTPISIISVAGEYRIGKSFLINALIDPLFFFCNHDNMFEFPKDNLRFDRRDNNGFYYACGDDSVTDGIHILCPPFIANKGGNRIAILLMDTQGLNAIDKKGGFDQILYALTCYLSSNVIYNIDGYIKPKQFQGLLFFSYYSKVFNYNIRNLLRISLFQE